MMKRKTRERIGWGMVWVPFVLLAAVLIYNLVVNFEELRGGIVLILISIGVVLWFAISHWLLFKPEGKENGNP